MGTSLLRCDFCGRETDRVRRVALEPGYDRLGHRHAVRYACRECSARKEAERPVSDLRSQVDGPQKPS